MVWGKLFDDQQDAILKVLQGNPNLPFDAAVAQVVLPQAESIPEGTIVVLMLPELGENATTGEVLRLLVRLGDPLEWHSAGPLEEAPPIAKAHSMSYPSSSRLS